MSSGMRQPHFVQHSSICKHKHAHSHTGGACAHTHAHRRALAHTHTHTAFCHTHQYIGARAREPLTVHPLSPSPLPTRRIHLAGVEVGEDVLEAQAPLVSYGSHRQLLAEELCKCVCVCVRGGGGAGTRIVLCVSMHARACVCILQEEKLRETYLLSLLLH